MNSHSPCTSTFIRYLRKQEKKKKLRDKRTPHPPNSKKWESPNNCSRAFVCVSLLLSLSYLNSSDDKVVAEEIFPPMIEECDDILARVSEEDSLIISFFVNITNLNIQINDRLWFNFNANNVLLETCVDTHIETCVYVCVKAEVT